MYYLNLHAASHFYRVEIPGASRLWVCGGGEAPIPQGSPRSREQESVDGMLSGVSGPAYLCLGRCPGRLLAGWLPFLTQEMLEERYKFPSKGRSPLPPPPSLYLPQPSTLPFHPKPWQRAHFCLLWGRPDAGDRGGGTQSRPRGCLDVFIFTGGWKPEMRGNFRGCGRGRWELVEVVQTPGMGWEWPQKGGWGSQRRIRGTQTSRGQRGGFFGQRQKERDPGIWKTQGGSGRQRRSSQAGGRNQSNGCRSFPGVPVVEMPCFHCRGHRFNPWSGN